MASQLVERLCAGLLYMPFTRLSHGLSWGVFFFSSQQVKLSFGYRTASRNFLREQLVKLYGWAPK